MKSLIATDAAEYNAATDRVNSALQLLRDEMKSLRHQDVTLMQQFLAMNDTIRSISKDQKSEKRRSKRLRNTTFNLSASANSTTPSWSIHLARQQSVHGYCDITPIVRRRTWSDSTDEESDAESLSNSLTSLNDDTDDSDNSMTSDVPVFNPALVTRQRSRSTRVPLSKHETSDNVNKAETILKCSKKSWKIAQSREDGIANDYIVEVDSEGEEKDCHC